MATVAVTVSYEGVEHEVSYPAPAPAWVIERSICASCSIPWGSVVQLTDEDGTVHVINSSIPAGSKLSLSVSAGAQPVSLGKTVKTVNVVEPDVASIVPECKIVLVGDGGVGKSSFVASLRGQAASDTGSTSGCDIIGMTLGTNRGPVGFKFWDVGGTAESGGVRDAYYASAHAAIVFFNFDALDTYWNVLKWQNEVHQICGDIPLVVVGCASHSQGCESGPAASTPALRLGPSGAGPLVPLLALLRQVTGDRTLCFFQDPELVVPEDSGALNMLSARAAIYPS